MARRALLDKVPLPAGNVHRIRGQLDPRVAAERYEQDLRVSGLPERPFDLVWLGMGADGHTASLFPGSKALGERNRLALAVYASHLNSWRVTLTLPAIRSALNVSFLISGTAKAAPLALIRAGRPLPAALARSALGTTTWFLDADAAGDQARS